MLSTSAFWVALAQIMVVNIMLSGDNAVVIALASRSLPPKQQKMAILFGSGAAIVLRIILTFFAVMLMELPYLKLVGDLALLWIATSMLNSNNGEGELESHSNLWAAVRTILVADFITHSSGNGLCRNSTHRFRRIHWYRSCRGYAPAGVL